MFRVIGFAFLIAVIASIASGGNSTVVAIAFVGVLGLLGFGLLVGLKLRCPQCGKRIKLGYTTCHHCGYSVVRG